MARSHDPAETGRRVESRLWTTPHEFTKSKKKQQKKTLSGKKRVYVTPLPALAIRILKGRLPGPAFSSARSIT
jgi:hypothetical protein